MQFEFQYSSDGSVNSSSPSALFIQSFKNLQDLNDYVESNQLTCYKTLAHNSEHAISNNKTYNTRSKRISRQHHNKEKFSSSTLNGSCSDISNGNSESKETSNCYNVKKLDDKLFLKYDNQEGDENNLRKFINSSLNACTKPTCKLGCVCESLDDSQTTSESYKKRSNNSLINNNSSNTRNKEHCGRFECMFECTCARQLRSTSRLSYVKPDQEHISSYSNQKKSSNNKQSKENRKQFETSMTRKSSMSSSCSSSSTNKRSSTDNDKNLRKSERVKRLGATNAKLNKFSDYFYYYDLNENRKEKSATHSHSFLNNKRENAKTSDTEFNYKKETKKLNKVLNKIARNKNYDEIISIVKLNSSPSAKLQTNKENRRDEMTNYESNHGLGKCYNESKARNMNDFEYQNDIFETYNQNIVLNLNKNLNSHATKSAYSLKIPLKIQILTSLWDANSNLSTLVMRSVAKILRKLNVKKSGDESFDWTDYQFNYEDLFNIQLVKPIDNSPIIVQIDAFSNNKKPSFTKSKYLQDKSGLLNIDHQCADFERRVNLLQRENRDFLLPRLISKKRSIESRKVLNKTGLLFKNVDTLFEQLKLEANMKSSNGQSSIELKNNNSEEIANPLSTSSNQESCSVFESCCVVLNDMIETICLLEEKCVQIKKEPMEKEEKQRLTRNELSSKQDKKIILTKVHLNDCSSSTKCSPVPCAQKPSTIIWKPRILENSQTQKHALSSKFTNLKQSTFVPIRPKLVEKSAAMKSLHAICVPTRNESLAKPIEKKNMESNQRKRKQDLSIYKNNEEVVSSKKSKLVTIEKHNGESSKTDTSHFFISTSSLFKFKPLLKNRKLSVEKDKSSIQIEMEDSNGSFDSFEEMSSSSYKRNSLDKSTHDEKTSESSCLESSVSNSEMKTVYTKVNLNYLGQTPAYTNELNRQSSFSSNESFSKACISNSNSKSISNIIHSIKERERRLGLKNLFNKLKMALQDVEDESELDNSAYDTNDSSKAKSKQKILIESVNEIKKLESMRRKLENEHRLVIEKNQKLNHLLKSFNS